MKSKLAVVIFVVILLASVFSVKIPITRANILEVGPGKPYLTIQSAIDAAGLGDTILVYPAPEPYAPFNVSGKVNLTIIANQIHTVVVKGRQSVMTNYGARDALIFVKNSINITLVGLDIEGDGLGGVNPKDYEIIYEHSSGTIRDCIVSP